MYYWAYYSSAVNHASYIFPSEYLEQAE